MGSEIVQLESSRQVYLIIFGLFLALNFPVTVLAYLDQFLPFLVKTWTSTPGDQSLPPTLKSNPVVQQVLAALSNLASILHFC